MKKILFLLLITCSVVMFACSRQPSAHVLRVGTIDGPETQLMEVAAKVAQEKYHLQIQIVPFSDYIQPNAALNDGSIDANLFQHQPWLESQIRDRHYKLMAIGKTFIYPMGVYPGKSHMLTNLPDGTTVAIPNDPSNEGRALLLLQQAGLLKLRAHAGLYATPADVASNPDQLKFIALDAAQLTRSLPDVGLAVINTNYAVAAGLYPDKDALFRENAHSPYANIIVIRENEAHDPRMQQLVDACHAPAVVAAAQKLFAGQAVPAW